MVYLFHSSPILLSSASHDDMNTLGVCRVVTDEATAPTLCTSSLSSNAVKNSARLLFVLSVAKISETADDDDDDDRCITLSLIDLLGVTLMALYGVVDKVGLIDDGVDDSVDWMDVNVDDWLIYSLIDSVDILNNDDWISWSSRFASNILTLALDSISIGGVNGWYPPIGHPVVQPITCFMDGNFILILSSIILYENADAS